MMTFKNAAIFAALAAVMVTGCTGGDSSGGTTTSTSAGTTGTASGDGAKKFTVAVIPKGATHEFWKAVHAGANAAAKELNGEVEIKWQGPEKEGDKTQQVGIVESMTNAGVNGMILAPLDEQALATPVQAAIDKKIPVIIIDSGLKGPETLSFIATDNYKGGVMAAQEMAKQLGDKGNIAMLRYEQGSASTEQREAGFLDEITKNHKGIKVLSSDQYAHDTADTARKASESLFASLKNPDGSLKIQGFYAPNESATFGSLLTLEENNWAGKVVFIGFDSSEKLIEGLKSGHINGLVIQNPYKMGYESVKAMHAFLMSGTKPDPKVDTGATLVTKANMETKEIADLLTPPRE
jgi:ribose transport system substrate-binding protein